MSDNETGQMSFEFPKKFDLEQMGTVLPSFPNSVLLHESFLTKELCLGAYGNLDRAKMNEETEVFCPFCQKGKLRLKEIEPHYSTGASRLSPSDHVGNTYTLDCSNDCGAEFSGYISWMCVD